MIYMIMMFEKVDTYKKTLEDGSVKDYGWIDLGDERIVGYYEDMETARQAVINNWLDIRETCYDYAVIEGIDPGIYPNATIANTKWFQWDKKNEKYVEIERPSLCGNHYSNFTIG